MGQSESLYRLLPGASGAAESLLQPGDAGDGGEDHQHLPGGRSLEELEAAAPQDAGQEAADVQLLRQREEEMAAAAAEGGTPPPPRPPPTPLEPGFSEKYLGAGWVHELKVFLPLGGTGIAWEWYCGDVGYDVGFRAEFQPESSSARRIPLVRQQPEALPEVYSLDTEADPAQLDEPEMFAQATAETRFAGRFCCSDPGTVWLTWSNDHSIIWGKTLRWRLRFLDEGKVVAGRRVLLERQGKPGPPKAPPSEEDQLAISDPFWPTLVEYVLHSGAVPPGRVRAWDATTLRKLVLSLSPKMFHEIERYQERQQKRRQQHLMSEEDSPAAAAAANDNDELQSTILIKALLRRDEGLELARRRLVPSVASEELFWRVYFLQLRRLLAGYLLGNLPQA